MITTIFECQSSAAVIAVIDGVKNVGVGVWHRRAGWKGILVGAKITLVAQSNVQRIGPSSATSPPVQLRQAR